MSQQMLDQLRFTLGKMEVALGAIKEAIVWTDTMGRIQWSNSTFDQLIGRAHIYTLGGNIFELLPLVPEGYKKDVSSDYDSIRHLHPVHLIMDNQGTMSGCFYYKKEEKTLILNLSVSYVHMRDDVSSIVMSIQDITLNRQLGEEKALLEHENQKISAMYEVQKDFTSTVSHELRTPLASIKAAIDILYSKTPGPLNEDQSKFLIKAKNNIDRLNRLINDILDLAKIETGKLVMRFELRDIHHLITEVVESHKILAQQKKLSLNLEFDPELRPFLFDYDRLSQVFHNLIGNALKFTDQGFVSIKSRWLKEQKQIEICVQDSGEGIAAEQIQSVFQKFKQLGDPSKRKTGGTGLGLAICQEVVRRHSGRIWVESQLGKGSCFYFTLPQQQGGPLT